MQGLLPPALKLQKIEFYVIVSWALLRRMWYPFWTSNFHFLQFWKHFEQQSLEISCHSGDSVIVNNIDRPKLNLTGDMREFIQ